MEHFTKRAHQAIVLACVEAERMGNAYLGTEHVLLALSSLRCTASNILVDRGVDLAALQKKTVELVGDRTRPLENQDPVDMGSVSAALERATPRLNKAFTRARVEAARLHRDQIGTEHLLLGMLDDSTSVATEALRSLGVNLDAVREGMSKGF